MADSECNSAGKKALIPGRRKGQGKLLFHYLCDELLTEILIRLPSTDAARFQLVCKRWYSLISSPFFAVRFLHRRHQRHVQSSLVLEFVYYCDLNCTPGVGNEYHSDFQIISDDCSLLSKVYGERIFKLSFLPRLREVRLEGSYADLILCSSITHTNETIYYVTNLLTKQWIALPPAPPLVGFIRSASVGFLCVPPPCSECKPVQQQNSEYKFVVVRIRREKQVVACSELTVQVFSREEREWRTVVVSSPLPLKHYSKMTALVAYRGMLHWLNHDCIVVYDPFNTPERFSRIIHLPSKQHVVSVTVESTSIIGVCRGCLRLVDVPAEDYEGIGDPALYVWELEDYESGIWKLVCRIYLESITNTIIPLIGEWGFLVLRLHPENGDVIYLGIQKGVIRLNTKTGIVEDYYPAPHRNPMFGWINAFNVADQWWPTPVSSLLH